MDVPLLFKQLFDGAPLKIATELATKIQRHESYQPVVQGFAVGHQYDSIQYWPNGAIRSTSHFASDNVKYIEFAAGALLEWMIM